MALPISIFTDIFEPKILAILIFFTAALFGPVTIQDAEEMDFFRLCRSDGIMTSTMWQSVLVIGNWPLNFT